MIGLARFLHSNKCNQKRKNMYEANLERHKRQSAIAEFTDDLFGVIAAADEDRISQRDFIKKYASYKHCWVDRTKFDEGVIYMGDFTITVTKKEKGK